MRKLVLYVVCSKQDLPCADELSLHLSVFEQVRKEIAVIVNHKFQAGTLTQEERSRALGEADLVVLLITPSFWDEYELALRAMALKKIVVPVLVCSTAWTDAEFGGLEPLPSDRRFLDRCTHRDAAWTEVVHGLQARWLPLIGNEKRHQAPLTPRISSLAGPGSSSSPLRADEKLRVLMIAANPSSTTRMQVGEELHRAETRTRRSPLGGRMEFILQPELRVNELAAALMRHAPHIVHFSGHGDEAGALMLVDPDHSERSRRLDPLALKQLFSNLNGNIRCVLLSACFSRSEPAQAQMLMDAVGCVIGTEWEASADRAIEFSASFYEALAFSRSIDASVNVGIAAIRALGGSEEFRPMLQVRPGVDVTHPLLTEDGGICPTSRPLDTGRLLPNAVAAPNPAGHATGFLSAKALRVVVVPTAAAALLFLGMHSYEQQAHNAATRPTVEPVPSAAIAQLGQPQTPSTELPVKPQNDTHVAPSSPAAVTRPQQHAGVGSRPPAVTPAMESSGEVAVPSSTSSKRSETRDGRPRRPPTILRNKPVPIESTPFSSDEQAALDKSAAIIACKGHDQQLATIKWNHLASEPKQRDEVEAACAKYGITLGD